MNEQLGLGGGCHWCTEAVMHAVPGVISVKQGYIAAAAPHDSLSEAVLVGYAHATDLELLLDIHLETHASTSLHSRRETYRSAIYYTSESQLSAIRLMMSTLSRKRNKNYITAILPLHRFEPSRESLQDYYRTRPDAPFCKRYIAPKLELVKQLIKNS